MPLSPTYRQRRSAAGASACSFTQIFKLFLLVVIAFLIADTITFIILRDAKPIRRGGAGPLAHEPISGVAGAKTQPPVPVTGETRPVEDQVGGNVRKDNGGVPARPEKVEAGDAEKEEEDHDETEPQAAESTRRHHIPRYAYDVSHWEINDDLESMIERELPRAHWGPYIEGGAHSRFTSTMIKAKMLTEEQRSRYVKIDEMISETGCDVLTVPVLPTNDARCQAYLADEANWKEVIPMDQKFDERTIKLIVLYKKFKYLKAIVKVPQRLFQSEPFGEIAAFHADRILGVNRIPVTTLACIPEHHLRAALSAHGREVSTVASFMRESHAHGFVDWVEKDFFDFAKKYGLTIRRQRADDDGHRNSGRSNRQHSGPDAVNDDGGEKEDSGANLEHCFKVSLQLVMAESIHFLDSAFRIPYIAHNDSWNHYYDLEANDFPPSLRIPLIHISQISVFDFVIGNDDRSPNKNNFVVGGCVGHRTRHHHHPDCGRNLLSDLKHPNAPTFVHLDQGMSFIGRTRRNPVGKKRKPSGLPKFCVFSVPLLNRLVDLEEARLNGEQSFGDRLMGAVPSDASLEHYVANSRVMHGCDKRISEVIDIANACLRHENAIMERQELWAKQQTRVLTP